MNRSESPPCAPSGTVLPLCFLATIERTCDAPGCQTEYLASTESPEDAARRAGIPAGWLEIDGKCYCPHHDYRWEPQIGLLPIPRVVICDTDAPQFFALHLYPYGVPPELACEVNCALGAFQEAESAREPRLWEDTQIGARDLDPFDGDANESCTPPHD